LFVGISTRKTKWALWSDCICDWEHFFINSIYFIGYNNSSSYNFLPPWSTKRIWTLFVQR